MARIALRLRRTVEDPADVTRARELGRRLADDGAAVGEALRHLRDETLQDREREPRHEEVVGLVEGWADTSLGHLQRLTCQDPLTGLDTMAHLRARVGELRRAGADPALDHALVVVTPPGPPARALGEGARAGGSWRESLEFGLGLAALGERVRIVFAGGETVAATDTGRRRLVVLADRDDRLGRRVALLRRLLAEEPDGPCAVRIVELPADELDQVLLLEHLAAG